MTLRLTAIVALSLASAGCAWDDPCYAASCGQGCTLCDPEDVACQQAEPARVCDEGGLCVIDLPGAAPICPPVTPAR